MRPIPVAFHIWFIEIHTYGIGLAITFWFGLRYTERRLRNAGYSWQWVTGMFLWVIAAAVVGARTLHVLSNLSYYSAHPGQVVAIWQGGLSSFGGLLFAVPVAILSQRRRCPELSTLRFADLMAPVLMASWGLGRLLGPQLMLAGGGHPTQQWFGMYYAGQVGKRLPVPIFQAMEDFAIFGALLLVERWLRHVAPAPFEADDAGAVLTAVPAYRSPDGGARSGDAPLASDGARPASPGTEGDGEEESSAGNPGATVRRALARAVPPPAGIVLGVGMLLWGVERYLDEHLWLGEDGHLGSVLVQWAGGALAAAGLLLVLTRLGPLRRWRRGELPGPPAGAEAGVETDLEAPADGQAGPEAGAEVEATGDAQAPGSPPHLAAPAGARAPGDRPGTRVDPV